MTSKKPDVYFINMRRSVERRKTFEDCFKSKYTLHRVEAYDGKLNLSTYTDVRVPEKDFFRSSTAEVATSFSHVRAILTALNDGHTEAIIMEDDASDAYRSAWPWKKDLHDIAQQAPEDADCVIFSCVNENELRKMFAMKKDFSAFVPNRWGTTCYLIRKSGMLKIKHAYVLKDGKTIDLQKHSKHRHANLSADTHIIYPVMKCYNFTRPTIHHNIRHASTIHTHHHGIHSRAEKCIHEWFLKHGRISNTLRTVNSKNIVDPHV